MKFIKITPCIICFCFLCSCQMVPEQDVVVNKGDVPLEKIIADKATSSSFKNYNYDKHWSETIQTNEKCNVSIDCDVSVPDVETISVWKAKPSPFTDEKIVRFIDYFG